PAAIDTAAIAAVEARSIQAQRTETNARTLRRVSSAVAPVRCAGAGIVRSSTASMPSTSGAIVWNDRATLPRSEGIQYDSLGADTTTAGITPAATVRSATRRPGRGVERIARKRMP